MSENKSSSSSSGVSLGGLVFIIFLIIKLTEKCAFWGDAFPRFLKSTEAWWDGWFMVFLPLWGGLIVAGVVLLIACLIAWILNR